MKISKKEIGNANGVKIYSITFTNNNNYSICNELNLFTDKTGDNIIKFHKLEEEIRKGEAENEK